ncbi:hypothetical protein PV325_009188 [Microctonus aethiopoides]|uniref:Uncharacterized protein n=1 Tax=Microctonus aethiopoides TaxID=144406 RepID=A0AA39F935_9HYME|nr:hypothetical protein PV325_009188 [Microctonus aethiopoides]KAK0099203.1 hypothetical protein PV326_000040 [Microctonus aethiopoides]KAK0165224.1 hypothetical protein PV328_003760 [Microctonus aethiopoides]
MAYLKLSSGISGFIILFITLLIGYAIGEYEHLFNNGNGLCVGTNCPDRSGNGISGAMWFGPRLGRRRRSGGMTTEDDNEMDDIIKAIGGGTWNFIPYYGVSKKRHSTQFTPRLGRELDEFLQKAIAINNNNHQTHLLDTKLSDVDLHRQLMQPISIPLFQPRLGRQQIYIPSTRLDH